MILHHVARNVADLTVSRQFYQRAFGCEPLGPIRNDPVLAALLGADQVLSLHLSLGYQRVELTQCMPPGKPYPPHAPADNLIFQHLAIVTTDIAAACSHALREGAIAISRGGPHTLPAASGGVTAWKFRDLDGHPLELLQYPYGSQAREDSLILGCNHTALCIADIARSISFYQRLGLKKHHHQYNHGPAQDMLDGLPTSKLEIITLESSSTPPHIELLRYHTKNRQAHRPEPRDIAADRLVFRGGPDRPALAHDPDGHAILCGTRA